MGCNFFKKMFIFSDTLPLKFEILTVNFSGMCIWFSCLEIKFNILVSKVTAVLAEYMGYAMTW